MKTNCFLLTAILGLALSFTFSCSTDDNSEVSSSSGGNISSPSGGSSSSVTGGLYSSGGNISSPSELQSSSSSVLPSDSTHVSPGDSTHVSPGDTSTYIPFVMLNSKSQPTIFAFALLMRNHCLLDKSDVNARKDTSIILTWLAVLPRTLAEARATLSEVGDSIMGESVLASESSPEA